MGEKPNYSVNLRTRHDHNMNTIFIFAMFLCPNDRWYIVLQGRQQFQTEPELVFCCSNSYCICGRHQRQTWNLSICHMFTPAKSPNLCFVIMWKPTKSPPPVEEKKNWEGEEENIWRRKIEDDAAVCFIIGFHSAVTPWDTWECLGAMVGFSRTKESHRGQE